MVFNSFVSLSECQLKTQNVKRVTTTLGDINIIILVYYINKHAVYWVQILFKKLKVKVKAFT